MALASLFGFPNIPEESKSIEFWKDPERSGWLTKQGEYIKTWRRRWFVLKEGHMFWFKDDKVSKDSQPRGVINVGRCLTIKGAEDVINRAHAFELSTSNDTLFFIADSDKASCPALLCLLCCPLCVLRRVTHLDSARQGLKEGLGLCREVQSAGHAHSTAHGRGMQAGSHSGMAGQLTSPSCVSPNPRPHTPQTPSSLFCPSSPPAPSPLPSTPPSTSHSPFHLSPHHSPPPMCGWQEKEDWINSVGRAIVRHSRSVTDYEVLDYDCRSHTRGPAPPAAATSPSAAAGAAGEARLDPSGGDPSASDAKGELPSDAAPAALPSA
ncbi:unnamed protein product [Closterium sp. Naga37s-1]|nr:unnamed protein product [Closterium sp. Naga37s-1]